MSRAQNSSRWCPTPEQLMILEEMYRSGTRTPNAPQIQQITAHLSFYGKIEGKNVFYWFQNHKARDRQKLRRKLYKQLQQQQQQQALYHHQHLMMINHCANPNNIVHGPHNNYNNNGLHFLEPPLNQNFQPQLSSSSSIGSMLPPQMQGRLFEDQYHQAPPNSTSHNQHHHHHQLMSYNWKTEIPVDHHQNLEKERMYDRDLMMMTTLDDNVGPEELHKPLKTLQLFPVTSTNLKEEALINDQLINNNMHG